MTTLADWSSQEAPSWLDRLAPVFWSLLSTLVLAAALITGTEAWTAGRHREAVVGASALGVLFLVALIAGWSVGLWTRWSHCADLLHLGVPRSPWGRWWLFWPLACAGFVVVAVPVGTWLAGRFPQTPEQYDAHLERSATLTGGVATQVLHAAAEEVIYRGVMLVTVMAVMAFVSRRWPWLRAVLVAAAAGTSVALFAVHHVEYGMANVLSCVVHGSVWVVVALVARSVWPTTAMHAGYNVAVLVP